MRIIVVDRYGKLSTIDLPNGTTWTVHEGPRMDHIREKCGKGYYWLFSGEYDGSSTPVPRASSGGGGSGKVISHVQEEVIRYLSEGGRLH